MSENLSIPTFSGEPAPAFSTALYPTGLLDWAGHRKGGVRRIFYDGSGRPSGKVIQTELLTRLEGWASSVFAGSSYPRVLLLVGGPGNGKTEAIEYTVRKLDNALSADGELVRALGDQFVGNDGAPPPRLAQTTLAAARGFDHQFDLAIVQDASAADPALPGKSPASLLVGDLAKYVHGDRSGSIYLACVNRGVLDDAMICALDQHDEMTRNLLESVIRAVGIGTDAPDCWPLKNNPTVAVWPMDVESLVSEVTGGTSPAGQLLDIATDVDLWPTAGSCPAGKRCPYCATRERLSNSVDKKAMLRILRWYELASGKRWSFRDLFSLFSYVFAGVPGEEANAGTYDPCKWAAKLVGLTENPRAKPESLSLAAPFLLVAAQYQHALFGHWPKLPAREFRKALKDVQLDGNPLLRGLLAFLTKSRHVALPPTMEQQLLTLCEALDPALADPDLEVRVSSNSTIKFRDLDKRFSRSVSEGLRYVQKYQGLTLLEVDLLKRLAEADELLSSDEVVRRNAGSARRLRAVVRDFSCRLTRRSVGVRGGAVRDSLILSEYEKVVQGDSDLLNSAVKKVKSLLNRDGQFTVTLNTTFGEPSPPLDRLAVLKTLQQKVRPLVRPSGDRPTSTLSFLAVGSGKQPRSVPLTYELFKSVRELESGLSTSSLPGSVVALLDTTRARMAGQIVRDDDDALDDAEITLGLKTEIVKLASGKFSISKGTP